MQITKESINQILDIYPILRSAAQLLNELKLNYGGADVQVAQPLFRPGSEVSVGHGVVHGD